MATGIVSTAAGLLGFPRLGQVLFWLNFAIYGVLLALLVTRVALQPGEVVRDLQDHRRAPGFLTLVAATSILGTQVHNLLDQTFAAFVLWVAACGFWCVLLYAFFALMTVRTTKPPPEEAFDGSWMLVVVSTQSLGVLANLLAPRLPEYVLPLLAISLGAFLIGGMFYLLLFSLVLQRFLLYPFDAIRLTPPYWINMGAVAITTLAGSTLVLDAPLWPTLGELLPFLKGLTVMFWMTACWWIPLLLLLGFWRHGLKRVPLAYDIQFWSMVFPMGMYAVCTLRLIEALGWKALVPVPMVVGVIAFAAWLLTFAGLVRRVVSIVRA